MLLKRNKLEVLLLISAIIICGACTNNDDKFIAYADEDGLVEVLAPEYESPSLLDSVLQYAPLRKDRYSIKDNNTLGLKKVHPKLVEYALLGRIVENLDGYYLKQGSSIEYYYFDRSELKDFVLFTILQRTEEGYDHFFLYGYDRELAKVTSLAWIGSAGGHAGESMSCKWFYYNSGYLMQSTILKLNVAIDGTSNHLKVRNKKTTTFQFYGKMIAFDNTKFVRE